VLNEATGARACARDNLRGICRGNPRRRRPPARYPRAPRPAPPRERRSTTPGTRRAQIARPRPAHARAPRSLAVASPAVSPPASNFSAGTPLLPWRLLCATPSRKVELRRPQASVHVPRRRPRFLPRIRGRSRTPREQSAPCDSSHTRRASAPRWLYAAPSHPGIIGRRATRLSRARPAPISRPKGSETVRVSPTRSKKRPLRRLRSASESRRAAQRTARP
jgi:hypothetical protein